MKRADRTVCIILLTIALAVLYILSAFIVVRVSGSSMEPTFKYGMMVIAKKCTNVDRNAVVLVKTANGSYIIKRLIGISGDDVLITKDHVYVNDVLVDSLTNSSDNNYRKHTQVPDGYSYILGDNREESTDSRNYGCVREEQIAGIVFLGF